MTSVENNTSSTKNIKGNRKVVVATYMMEIIFKLPDGIDLEDKTVVADWYVRWGTLHINYVDGREEEIEQSDGMSEPDWKRPDDQFVIDADRYCVEYSEDEEEEEEDDDAVAKGEMYEVRAFGNADEYVFEKTFNNITEARVCYENIKKEISKKGWGDAEIMLDDITDPKIIVCVCGWSEEDDEEEEEEEEK